MTDHDRDVAELVALVEGLEGYMTCACRRVYRVACAERVPVLIKRIKASLANMGADEQAAFNGRFALIEVDDKT